MQLLRQQPVPSLTMVLTASAPSSWGGASLIRLCTTSSYSYALKAGGPVLGSGPALIVEHFRQAGAEYLPPEPPAACWPPTATECLGLHTALLSVIPASLMPKQSPKDTMFKVVSAKQQGISQPSKPPTPPSSPSPTPVQKTDCHLRAALMLSEVPACLTLLTQASYCAYNS
eukprot:1157984-Pelagomonas_calceolata.AAC.3